MKLHWGYGILFTIAAFAAMILFMVYKASQINVDLVASDYYAQEVAYQGKLDKMSRAHNLPQKPEVNLVQEGVEIKFPPYFKGREIEGKVYFFRPSASGLDITLPLSIDSNLLQIIPADKLQSGRYDVKIDWTADRTDAYFQENTLFIP